MTTPSEPTTPTPEQRAATINDMCPEGWSVRPSGSSLAIVNPGAPDAPPAVIHADDASIVATIWTWHARALETSRTEALNTRREAVRCGEEVVAARLKLAEIVAEFSAGMFTPADFIKRAVDVDEALREIRERRRLDREERDAREAALVKAAKREDVPAELAPFAALSSKQETMDAEAFLLDIEGSVQVRDGRVVTGIDGPVPVRAAGWTGITWMSGRGRAKSLTVPGLQTRGDLGPNALRSAEMERLSQKAIKVLQRRDRLYAFHLPGGVKRYGYVDTWGYLRAGEPLSISIRPPEGKAVRQGIAWRRPGHDVDSFAEVPIRPTFDGDGGQVIEVRGELPGDLQHEIRQTSRDRLTITVTTANGAKITGPVTAWRVARSPECVVWHLTVPLRSPPPRT